MHIRSLILDVRTLFHRFYILRWMKGIFSSIVTNTENSLGWMDSNVKCILRRRLNDFSHVLFVCGLEQDYKKIAASYLKNNLEKKNAGRIIKLV